jgi:2-isopropylmalate synthase
LAPFPPATRATPPLQFFFYDTTLRDGAQGEGISLSCDDKIRIAARLHEFGAHFIEGGWPGSNPKDAEFFERAREELAPEAWCKVAAFGSTRYKGIKVDEDKQVQMLLDSGANVITLVGKAWDLHVDVVLETSREENIAMIRDTVKYLKGKGRTVMLDAEHYFDGVKGNHDYALECLGAAVDGGVDWLVLCDTNGASLPWEIEDLTKEVRFRFPQTNVGIHCHNDQGMAVANSIASVRGGAGLIQGTVNGYGERTGNANVMSILPTLELRMGYDGVGKDSLSGLTGLSRYVDEQANQPNNNFAAYVGTEAFAPRSAIPRKAKQHTDPSSTPSPSSSTSSSGLSVRQVTPENVGNLRGGVSAESGADAISKMKGMFLEKYSTEKLRTCAEMVFENVRVLEERGYFLGLAEASVDLMIRRSLPDYTPPFETLDYHVTVWDDQPGQYGSSGWARATVKVKVSQEFVNRYLVKELRKLGDLAADASTAASLASKMAEEMNKGGAVMLEVAEGNGPVNALSKAMVKALLPLFPSLEMCELTDYKVRQLGP